MKWALKVLIALAIALMPGAAMAQSSSALEHANSNASFNRGGDPAPFPILGAGLPAFGVAGIGYWLLKRRTRAKP